MQNKVTQEQINKLMEGAEMRVRTIFDKCTVVSMQLANGFILTESSACVDSNNYDFDIGMKICRERIENKLWELEGYALQKAIFENKQPIAPDTQVCTMSEKERVVQELKELTLRRERVEDFIADHKDSIAAASAALLREQSQIMYAYIRVLERRLEIWKDI